jgi:2-haloalkanoic acid dehalogenase type II
MIPMFMEVYLKLDCYPEVPEALSILKSRGFRLAVLSNGTPVMLEAAVKNSGIEELIEKNFSVEAVGIFKPDPRVYQIAVDGMKVRSEEIVLCHNCQLVTLYSIYEFAFQNIEEVTICPNFWKFWEPYILLFKVPSAI